MRWLVVMTSVLLNSIATNVHAAQPVLVIWHVYSVDFFTEVSQQFERQTGVKIVAKAVISDDMQRNAFLAQQVGFSPDLLIMPSDQLMYTQMQGFTPFPDTSLVSIDRETVAPNNLGIYLNAGSPILLYYNKRLVSEVATSFEQIINDTKGGAGLSIDLTIPYITTPFWTAFNIIDESNDITANSGKAITELLNYLKALIKNNNISPLCLQDTCLNDVFVNGKSAYALDGIWRYGDLITHMGDNVGIAPMPTLNGRPMRSISIPNMMVAYRELSDEQYSAAAKFADFLQQRFNTTEYQNEVGLSLKNLSSHQHKGLINQLQSDVVIPAQMDFVGCLFHHLQKIWPRYLNDEITSDELTAFFLARIQGNQCEIYP